jgi:hypothetical protein
LGCGGTALLHEQPAKSPPIIGFGAVICEVVEALGNLAAFPAFCREQAYLGVVNLSPFGTPASAGGTLHTAKIRLPGS